MKRALFATLLALAAAAASGAPDVSIARLPMGSGAPGQPGFENADMVENNIYHAPQYLPGHPTARTIWARVVYVSCRRVSEAVECDGYHWSPAMGRAEYLYFTPVFSAAPETR